MGKIDDMRRQREEAFAEAERRASKRAVAKPNAAAPAAPAAPAARSEGAEPAQPTRPERPSAKKKEVSSKSGGSVDAQGKCPVCGKMKPLSGDVMASHQKGFGKACPGSKQKPA